MFSFASSGQRAFLSHAALLAVAAYLLAVPWAGVAVRSWSGHDVARLAQMLLGLVCALALALTMSPHHRPAKLAMAQPWAKGLAALAVLAAAAVSWAPVPAMAGRELALWLGLMAMAAVVATGAAREDTALRLLNVAAVATTLYSALVVLIALTVLASGAALSRPDLFTGYDNLRFFNHVQTVALPLSLAAALHPGNSVLMRRIAQLALVLGGLLLFVSAGRGTFLALLGGIGALGLVLGRRAWPVVTPLMAALALGGLLFTLLFVLLPATTATADVPLPDYDTRRLGSDQARLYLWQVAWQHIQAHPGLGVGPMHYAHMPNAKAAHPHNLPLQLAAEWGLPFALLSIALTGAAMVGFVKRLRGQARGASAVHTGAALFLGCVAVLVDSLVSGNFVMPVSQVWIAVLAGLGVAWCRAQGPGSHTTSPSPWVQRVVPALLLASQVWLLAHTWPEVSQLPAHLQGVVNQFPNVGMQPRFWSIGRF
jgi:O-antigen ligase